MFKLHGCFLAPPTQITNLLTLTGWLSAVALLQDTAILSTEVNDRIATGQVALLPLASEVLSTCVRDTELEKLVFR
ncbi:hypothetical protein RRG08_050118 [Elysia crispata]|uniref:Uncharacterized protein n=1 Tax=Elysia crispata TaxID=231223 RepID=A0AAE0Z6Z7_9GAST|nr:hypothetical protein RRG08_050118 [Elysia crispata]